MPTQPNRFPFKIGNVVLCEEVRAELYGKYSILGAFSGDIIVPYFGGNLRTSLYLELIPLELGALTVIVDFSYAGRPALEAKIEMEVVNVSYPAVITLPAFPVGIEKAGDLVAYVVFNGVRRRVMKKAVRIGEMPQVSPSNVWPLPSSQSQTVAPEKARKRGRRPPSAPPSDGEP